MATILYSSNTGFTEKYAKMLGNELNIPVMNMTDRPKLENDESVIYMGWVMAGSVIGYKKAASKYNIIAIIAVGMSPADNTKQIEDLRAKCDLSSAKLFYLQGGYDYTKLKGIYRFMMGFVTRMQDNGKEKSPQEAEYIKMCKNGFDNVSADNIGEITEWCKQRQ